MHVARVCRRHHPTRSRVAAHQSQDLVDDLAGDDLELSELAQALEMQVKRIFLPA